MSTLKKWHEGHPAYAKFIAFNFLCFPVISWVMLLLSVWYINNRAPQPRMKRISAVFEGKNKKKILALKHSLQNEFALSLTFVMFAIILSSIATYFAHTTSSTYNDEIGRYYRYKNTAENFKFLYSIVHVVLAQDILIAVMMPLIFLMYPILQYILYSAKKFFCENDAINCLTTAANEQNNCDYRVSQ